MYTYLNGLVYGEKTSCPYSSGHTKENERGSLFHKWTSSKSRNCVKTYPVYHANGHRVQVALLLCTFGNKAQITVVGCVNAAGLCLLPMVIRDRKTLALELCDGEVPGTVYGLSDQGWIDMELFDIWFSNHFLRYAPRARPLLLLLDGHSSHCCPEMINLAAAEQVIIFALPPNTTHLTQPLHKCCFGPLKVCWKEACQDYIKKNPGKVVSRYSLSKIFSEAWMKSMTIQNITVIRTVGN